MKKVFCIVAVVLGFFFTTSFTAFADCPDVYASCVKLDKEGKIFISVKTIAGSYLTGQCWSWWPFGCYPCASGGELASKCEKVHHYACKASGYGCVACVHESGRYQASSGTACFNEKGEEVPISGGDL